MSYFVTCSFDLVDADSSDYENAYEALQEIGLDTEIESKDGKIIQLPNTTTVGKFDGSDCASVRTFVMDKVKISFKNLSLKSKIFISVGGDWCWTHKD